MFKKLAAILGIAIVAMVGIPAIAGAAPVDRGWYVESYSAGTVLHWVQDQNHHTMDLYDNGVYVGNVFDEWLPAAATFTFWPANGSINANIRHCVKTGINYQSIEPAPGSPPPGWEGSFKFNHYGGGETYLGAYHYGRSSPAYRVFTRPSFDNTCASGKMGYRHS